jgi:hypothetical protein
MTLIHTCELKDVNPFDYLTELQRRTEDLAASAAEWMPRNYRSTSSKAAQTIDRGSALPYRKDTLLSSHEGRKTRLTR